MDPEDAFAVSEVNSAYSDVSAVDPLDLSDGGTNAWKTAIEASVGIRAGAKTACLSPLLRTFQLRRAHFSGGEAHCHAHA